MTSRSSEVGRGVGRACQRSQVVTEGQDRTRREMRLMNQRMKKFSSPKVATDQKLTGQAWLLLDDTDSQSKAREMTNRESEAPH